MIDVIGVGADGLRSLGPAQRALLDSAEVVLGGERLVSMVEPLPGRELLTWPSPLKPALPATLARIGTRRAVVLASGDPSLSGIGSSLVELLGIERVRIHPAVSSAALARARMGWSAEDSEVITLVGRSFDRLRRAVSPRARLIVLSHGDDAPARLATLLVEEGYAASRVTVLGDLGTPDESRHEGTAGSWAGQPAPRLHLVCLECRADGSRPPRSLVPGLPDAAYDHDGQLTKRIVRAAALAHLAPQPGDVMWDLGAGAGSVGIEFARQHPRIRTYAVERVPERAARIRANAAALGVPDLVVTEGVTADVIDDFPSPDAVFVGGGATIELVDRVWTRLAPGGRLVVHGVTVQTEAVMLAGRAAYGGSMIRIAVDDLERLGGFHGWRPARAVTQWSVIKTSGQERP